MGDSASPAAASSPSSPVYDSAHVQMYMLPSGSKSLKKQHTDQDHHQTSSSPGHLQPASVPLERGDSNKVHRTESLESLLSLSVLASELLHDHEDLSSIGSVTSSPKRQAWYGSPISTRAYSDEHAAGSPSSHKRFESYSTVSSDAPVTPATSSHPLSYDTSPHTPPSVENSIDHSFDSPASRNSISSRSLRHKPKSRSIAQELAAQAQSLQGTGKQSTAVQLAESDNALSVPQLSLRQSAIVDGDMGKALEQMTLTAVTPEEDVRTPLAEAKDPLESSVLVAEGEPSVQQAEEGVIPIKEETPSDTQLHSAVTESQELQRDIDDNGANLVIDESIEDDAILVSHVDKGKGRAVDEDVPTSQGAAQEIGTERMEQAEELSNRTAPAGGAGSTLAMPSTGGSAEAKTLKISDWLREQYNTKQRTGAFESPPVAGPVPKKPSATIDTAKSAAGAGTAPIHSATGDRPNARPTSPVASSRPSSPLSASSNLISGMWSQGRQSPPPASPRTERAGLLHSILAHDFGKKPSPAKQEEQSPSKDLLWHPTEYVGPPRRRRSMGSGSLLTFKRPGNGSNGIRTHQRALSSDNLSSFRSVTPTPSSEPRAGGTLANGPVRPVSPGPQQAIAATQPDMSPVTRQKSPSTLSRTYSIKRKQPPSDVFDTEIERGSGAASPSSASSPKPFQRLLEVDQSVQTPPPTPPLRPVSNHKRSLSGSFQSFLPSLNSSATLARHRNVSAPVQATEIAPETPSNKWTLRSATSRPISPSGNHQRNWSEPWNPLKDKTGNQRRSPFGSWRSPSFKKPPAEPEKQPTLPILASRTVVQTEDSPASALPQTGSPRAVSPAQASPVANGSPKRNMSTRKKPSQDFQPASQNGTIAEVEPAVNKGLPSSPAARKSPGPEDVRILGLASDQVARDVNYRSQVVEKFKDPERSASSLSFHDKRSLDLY